MWQVGYSYKCKAGHIILGLQIGDYYKIDNNSNGLYSIGKMIFDDYNMHFYFDINDFQPSSSPPPTNKFRLGDEIEYKNDLSYTAKVVSILSSSSLVIYPGYDIRYLSGKYKDEQVFVMKDELEKNWQLIKKQENKVAVPCCTCDPWTIFNRGCKCGAFKYEMASKSKN